jgi:hypothetical protein
MVKLISALLQWIAGQAAMLAYQLRGNPESSYLAAVAACRIPAQPCGSLIYPSDPMYPPAWMFGSSDHSAAARHRSFYVGSHRSMGEVTA